MTDDRATFCGTYSDWKLIRTRSVVQIIFEVPLEASGDAYRVLGGMPQPSKEVWCAIARLNNGKEATTPVEPLAPKPAPSADNAAARAPSERKWHEITPAQQAGIRCNEPAFVRFLQERHRGSIVSTNDAEEFVRAWCEVESRRDIRSGQPLARWQTLEGDYRAWQIAPQVGAA
jgi:hypothetical protein